MLGRAEPDNAIRAAECDFAKWRGIPRETTRAVPEDRARNPEKCGELPKRRESGRIRFPEGKPCKPGGPAAAAGKIGRAPGGAADAAPFRPPRRGSREPASRTGPQRGGGGGAVPAGRHFLRHPRVQVEPAAGGRGGAVPAGRHILPRGGGLPALRAAGPPPERGRGAVPARAQQAGATPRCRSGSSRRTRKRRCGLSAARSRTASHAWQSATLRGGAAPEAARAVLEDHAKDQKKYEELLEKRGGGRIRAPEGGPRRPGGPAAAMDRPMRATGKGG